MYRTGITGYSGYRRLVSCCLLLIHAGDAPAQTQLH